MKEFVVAKSRKRTVRKKTKKRKKATRTRAKRAAAQRSSKKPARKGAKKSAKKARRTRANAPPVSKSKGKSKIKSKVKSSVSSTRANESRKPAVGKPHATRTSAQSKPDAARKTFYITTAIAYPNGAPHIGHAYEAIATDALARFQRLDGKDVFFLTGTDEHGQKMIQTADAEKLTPMEVATRNAQRFKEMDLRLNISFDRFIRTTEEQHHRSSQEIWNRMAANGDIYLDSYAGWYSVRDEAYYAE